MKPGILLSTLFAATLLSGLVVNAIVGGLISLYILFQIRPLYQSSGAPAAGVRYAPRPV